MRENFAKIFEKRSIAALEKRLIAAFAIFCVFHGSVGTMSNGIMIYVILLIDVEYVFIIKQVNLIVRFYDLTILIVRFSS